jgi:hypothetical protein
VATGGGKNGLLEKAARPGRSAADAALALAFAAGKTLAEAAQAAGISERTASRRRADPDFAARVGDLRTEMVRRAVGKLADGMAEAAEVLRGLLGARSESVRLAAARTILELGSSLRQMEDLDDLDARLRALECPPDPEEVTRDEPQALSQPDGPQGGPQPPGPAGDGRGRCRGGCAGGAAG